MRVYEKFQMKFAIGYQHTGDSEPFSAIVADYRDRIGEVYTVNARLMTVTVEVTDITGEGGEAMRTLSMMTPFSSG